MCPSISVVFVACLSKESTMAPLFLEAPCFSWLFGGKSTRTFQRRDRLNSCSFCVSLNLPSRHSIPPHPIPEKFILENCPDTLRVLKSPPCCVDKGLHCVGENFAYVMEAKQDSTWYPRLGREARLSHMIFPLQSFAFQSHYALGLVFTGLSMKTEPLWSRS